MSVKISVEKEFGIKKPIEVKLSNRNMLKTIKLQKVLSKMDVIEAENKNNPESVAYVTAFEETLNSVIEYIAEILNVDENKVEELEFSQTMNLAVKLMGAIMKIEPVAVSEANEPTDLKA